MGANLVDVQAVKLGPSHSSKRSSMTYPICREAAFFNFDNDVASCYDRIILALASLVIHKYGQLCQGVTVHAKTLEEARYKLRMALRLSDTEYSHCIQFPLYGTGQGSSNFPCIWLFISSTLFDIHDEQAHGAQFKSPDGHESIRLTMVGFVDDTTGSCNHFRPQTQLPIDVLTQKMEHDTQIWQDLLHASDGALELTKSSFQTLHFTFLPNGQPQAMIDATDHAIQLRDSTTGRLIPITALPADKAHKTLGHYKALADQKQKCQLAEILTKAKRNSVLIGSSPISRYGATLAYFRIFLSAVKYPLPQSFFDKKTLDQTESKVMGTIIARCGYNRHTAHVILYGHVLCRWGLCPLVHPSRGRPVTTVLETLANRQDDIPNASNRLSLEPMAIRPQSTHPQRYRHPLPTSWMSQAP
jgi:hypothetical protein